MPQGLEIAAAVLIVALFIVVAVTAVIVGFEMLSDAMYGGEFLDYLLAVTVLVAGVALFVFILGGVVSCLF